jgi:hypothetical protein
VLSGGIVTALQIVTIVETAEIIGDQMAVPDFDFSFFRSGYALGHRRLGLTSLSFVSWSLSIVIRGL